MAEAKTYTAAVLLWRMGADAKQVAAFLKEKGIKGRMDNPCDDPVCRYLKKELGTEDVEIEFGSVFINSNGCWTPDITLPDAVEEFITRFDQNEFPHLVE